MKRNKTVLVMALTLVFLAIAVPSQPVPVLRLSADGGAPVTITDQLAGDMNPAVGAVTFLGPVGDFSFNVSTGFTKPILGSALSPSMDLNSVDISSDRKSTRLNSSHQIISYAVFCLKKKNDHQHQQYHT